MPFHAQPNADEMVAEATRLIILSVIDPPPSAETVEQQRQSYGENDVMGDEEQGLNEVDLDLSAEDQIQAKLEAIVR
jgi:hypothetical protein